MGGTLFHLTAEAVSALVGMERMLPRLEECLAWARALAGELAEAGLAPSRRTRPTRRRS